MAGRPLKFASVEELQERIDRYFVECDNQTRPFVTKNGDLIDIPHKRPYTITGLALALDTTRETLLEYEGEVSGREKSPEYADTIKKAKLRCQHYAEEYLFSGQQATGAIFNLKNNYNWKDTSQIDLNNNVRNMDNVPEDVMETLGKSLGHASSPDPN